MWLYPAEANGKRDVVDFLINSFGLGQVWQIIQQSGQNLFAQFQAVLTQLLFAGQTAWNNAKPIFAQLVQVQLNYKFFSLDFMLLI